jgi:hypothetical protein
LKQTKARDRELGVLILSINEGMIISLFPLSRFELKKKKKKRND